MVTDQAFVQVPNILITSVELIFVFEFSFFVIIRKDNNTVFYDTFERD